MRDLLEGHLAFALAHSKPEDVHALGPDAPVHESITVCAESPHSVRMTLLLPQSPERTGEPGIRGAGA